MCGIAGYVGEKESADILISALKSLEYRGYDSAGVAIIDNNKINIVKSAGRVKVLEEKVATSNVSGNIGIAHTRWATHGKPAEVNSHPHFDCKKEIAVVHNGIIENYQILKDELIKKGHKFLSETDTEVIAHLLEEILGGVSEPNEYESKLLQSAKYLYERLEGSYAISIIWQKLPNVIVGIKCKSPLVCGLGEGENFLSSDVSAFNKFVDKAIYLEDNDIVLLKEKDVKVYSKSLEAKKYNTIKLSKDIDVLDKAGFAHYMIKEIWEQPITIKATIQEIAESINKGLIKKDDLKDIENILIIGCGTAYHASLLGRYFMEEIAGVSTISEYASEYKYMQSGKSAESKNTLAIFISQSGETADTISAFEKAKSHGFKTISVCNVFGSTLTRLSDYTIYTKCGVEVSVASTKAFTSQVVSLLLLSILIGEAKGRINKKVRDEYFHDISALPILIERILMDEKSIISIAEKYHTEKAFIFLGRTFNYPIALEGALKLKEISYLQAEAFPAGEIKHGPIAIINEDMPVISIMPTDSLFDKMVNACEEVKARGARVIGIIDEKGVEKINKNIDDVIVLPNAHGFLFPFLSAVALQIIAYHIARLNDREIDKPRNLAKSVTVE